MKGVYATSQCVTGILLYEAGLFFITWWKSMHMTHLFLLLGIASIGLGLFFFLCEPKKIVTKMSIPYFRTRNINN